MTDDLKNPKYPTWRAAAKHIWKEGGPKVSHSLSLSYLRLRKGLMIDRGRNVGLLSWFPTMYFACFPHREFTLASLFDMTRR